MLLLRAQSKVFSLTLDDERFGDAPVVQADTVASFENLLTELRRDANDARQLDPSVAVLDSDGISKNQRMHRITTSAFLRAHLEPLRPTCGVVVIRVATYNDHVAEVLRRISNYDVARLLVCRYDADVNACMAAINLGHADGAVSLESTTARDLASTLELLKLRKAQQKQHRIADLIGYGETSFLKDPTVMKFVTTKGARLGAVELRLRLDPPGILLVGHNFSPVFLMICDKAYFQGLREIALDISSRGLDEAALGSSFTRFANNFKTIPKSGRWIYCELPYTDLPKHLL